MKDLESEARNNLDFSLNEMSLILGDLKSGDLFYDHLFKVSHCKLYSAYKQVTRSPTIFKTAWNQ